MWNRLKNSALDSIQIVLLFGILGLGLTSLTGGVSEAWAQQDDSAEPVCHTNPEVCFDWAGGWCEGSCTGSSTVCCQP